MTLKNFDMTQEEKELLIKDLSARLPYRVQYKDAHGYKKTLDIWSPEFHTALNTILYDGKPSLYLRSMSSMTEEELKEFAYKILQQPDLDAVRNWQTISIDLEELSKVSYWLNKKMFDYRGLIPKGLALEAPEGMYNTK
jgi:hypothetical protein